MVDYLSVGGNENKQFAFLSFTLSVQVSEAIMEEEDEQANVDRNIDEIDEQM